MNISNIKTMSLMALLTMGAVACNSDEPLPEIPASTGAVISPEVGGTTQPNQVFIDLSTESTTVVNKDNWDLGFYNGDEFKVILNYASYTMARPTTETDLANVTDELVTQAYKDEMKDFLPNTEWKDAVDGDLSKTAIAEISATDANNPVYVINRGVLDDANTTERGFVKARITLSGNDYIITYGDINDASGFSTITVPKSTTNDFTYISFDTNDIVEVAPPKGQWDIMMTTFFNEFDNQGEVLSFKFKDFSLTNHQYVKSVSVAGDQTAFDAFTIDDVAGLALANDRLAVGSSWRLFDFTTNEFAINNDIFYIIEDADGNVYKLKFTKMLNDQGERGNPEFIYEILSE